MHKLDVNQGDVKKQEELENASLKLKEEVAEVEKKLETEVANHQKAKEGQNLRTFCSILILYHMIQ